MHSLLAPDVLMIDCGWRLEATSTQTKPAYTGD